MTKKYIDAEKLIAEIEVARKNIEDLFLSVDCSFYEGNDDAYDRVLGIINSLQQEQPSLPSNIDEAANKFAVSYDQGTCDGIAQDCFKAGAEWMAGQGVLLNLSIDELSCGAYNSCVEQGLTSEDDVIIQIRKKQM